MMKQDVKMSVGIWDLSKIQAVDYVGRWFDRQILLWLFNI